MRDIHVHSLLHTFREADDVPILQLIQEPWFRFSSAKLREQSNMFTPTTLKSCLTTRTIVLKVVRFHWGWLSESWSVNAGRTNDTKDM